MSRPTKLNDLTVKKLEDAFIVGATVLEACFNANISKQTYYNWVEENPELLDRFELLKQSPILKARKTIVKALENDPKIAMRFLERKLKDEFGYKDSEDSRDSKEIVDELISRFVDPDDVGNTYIRSV
ncbi:MAG: hypothetical protein PHP96_02520 [Candidatus Dojkabacteria bacterium]|nr:hypothetical protein [Candidatus Dojkabacteria bacterium]MDD4561204.1 hypothetical protein [Candidatus Dojkabacteria bacterium]